MGKRSLVQSLTTLACMGDRANYFRSELMATLKIIDRGDVPAEKLERVVGGSVRADAIHALDLPAPGGRFRGRRTARYRRFRAGRARFDGEYLLKSGWRPGLPWGFEVKLPDDYSGPSGRKAKQSMSFWASRGLTRVDGRPLGEGELRCSYLQDAKGRLFW